MAKGASKGSEFERVIAKRLSLWWSDGERDDIFWRVKGSGGRATNRKKNGKQTANADSDICAEDASGFILTDYCSIEIKRGYSNCDMLDCVDTRGKKPPIMLQHIQQVYSSCVSPDRENKFAILIIKRDYRKTVIGVESYLFDSLYEWLKDSSSFPKSNVIFPNLTFETVMPDGKPLQLTFMDFESFLAWVTPNIMKEALKV